MATCYVPLVLLLPLVPLQNHYQSWIPHFTGTEATTAQQHVDRISDAFEYMEIEDETIRMRMFSQSLVGEPKKWFKSLTPSNIHDLPKLYQTFINKWEIRKNPIQILLEYNNLK